jgi:hypothetical protein
MGTTNPDPDLTLTLATEFADQGPLEQRVVEVEHFWDVSRSGTGLPSLTGNVPRTVRSVIPWPNLATSHTIYVPIEVFPTEARVSQFRWTTGLPCHSK